MQVLPCWVPQFGNDEVRVSRFATRPLDLSFTVSCRISYARIL
ncbi:MAG: hypothetical protein JWN09_145 [Microbacteriaceae bacterium]|jgi:hypothetical protein|nr:hypothetical protein [Microbacteriaceae bacterium]